ncbi:helix-turn-helix domain-containing protein [Streptomyces sp. NBC_00828]|uniref:helix-turn-helix domain-containing protein n=1 Tax=Streptomyces sp. NBC_00828 TaxID=2903678 RepID=UPI00386AB6D2
MKKAAYGHKTPHQTRIRSQIVLMATRGRPNARIAVEVGVHVDAVRTWRGRFADGGLPALADRRRSGRPARFTPVQVAEAKALACRLPAETGVPLARWSCPTTGPAWQVSALQHLAGGCVLSSWRTSRQRSRAPGCPDPVSYGLMSRLPAVRNGSHRTRWCSRYGREI